MMTVKRDGKATSIAIGVTWLLFALSFEFPIPEEMFLFWLLRAALVIVAAIGVIFAFAGRPRWKLILGTAAGLLVIAYVVRISLLVSGMGDLELVRAASGPVAHLLEGYKNIFAHYWIDLGSPIRAIRFAYRDIAMPILQIGVLLWFLYKNRLENA